MINRIYTSLNRLLSIVNIFRLLIVLLLVILNTPFGIVNTTHTVPFYGWVSLYLVFILFFWFYTKESKGKEGYLFYINMVDIVLMSYFMYLTGNLQGYGVLILPFVATASLLGTGKNSLFYGSFATICILLCAFFQVVTGQADNKNSELYIFFQAGMLSSACLFVSLVTSVLTKSLLKATEETQVKEEEIANLNRLNELVLQGLHDAVIVLDSKGDVRQFNAQAKSYFSFLNRGKYYHVFQPVLNNWKESDEPMFAIDAKLNNVKMSGRGISVEEQGDALLLLFLRSAEDLANESQKIKLESLGRLTANIAHEIRNPLSAIRQSNEFLSEHGEDAFSQKFTNIISKNVSRIDQLVEEVLILNRRDRVNPTLINLAKYIGDFLNEFELAKPEAKGHIKAKINLIKGMVYFDFGHLQQILWNLFNNAWQHSDVNNPLIIIYITEVENKSITISISDSGPGIKSAIQDKIFEPFFTTEKNGTGLGLYIARELALTNGAYLDYVPQTKRFEMKCKVK